MHTISRKKREQQAKLEADIAAYKANGGKVDQIPFGETATPDGMPIDYQKNLDEKRMRGWVRLFGRGL